MAAGSSSCQATALWCGPNWLVDFSWDAFLVVLDLCQPLAILAVQARSSCGWALAPPRASCLLSSGTQVAVAVRRITHHRLAPDRRRHFPGARTDLPLEVPGVALG